MTILLLRGIGCDARDLGNYLKDQSFEGIIAHSLGGLIGATMIARGFIDVKFFIAIETAFIPQ